MSFTTMKTKTNSLTTVNELIDLGYKISKTEVIGYATVRYHMFRVILK